MCKTDQIQPKTLKVKETTNIYEKNFKICPVQIFMHTSPLKFGPWPVLLYSLNLGNFVSGFIVDGRHGHILEHKNLKLWVPNLMVLICLTMIFFRCGYIFRERSVDLI